MIPSWYDDSDYTVNIDRVKEQVGGDDQSIEDLVDDGVEVSTDQDIQFFSGPKWVLHFKVNADWTVSKKSKPAWVYYTGRHARDAFTYDDDKLKEKYHCVLPSDNQPPEPFDATEPEFIQALSDVFNSADYEKLKAECDHGEPWFSNRRELFREFWPDVQKKYRALKDE